MKHLLSAMIFGVAILSQSSALAKIYVSAENEKLSFMSCKATKLPVEYPSLISKFELFSTFQTEVPESAAIGIGITTPNFQSTQVTANVRDSKQSALVSATVTGNMDKVDFTVGNTRITFVTIKVTKLPAGAEKRDGVIELRSPQEGDYVDKAPATCDVAPAI